MDTVDKRERGEDVTGRKERNEGLEKVWRLVLGELKRELTDAEFAAYIEPTHLRGAEGDTLLLEVGDDFTRREIERRFSKVVEDVLEYVTRSNWKLRCVVAKRAARKQASTGEDGPVPAPARRASDRAGEPGPVEQAPVPNLNAKYTMDAFVVGENNRFAHAVSLAVTTNPGDIYNPVFLHGGVGLGKTHLMQAIGHSIYGRASRSRILYVTSEVFSNDFIAAIQRKSPTAFESFRRKYRDIDVLLIDDVQFFAGKEGLQEEFFHTFNELYQGRKQIVLSSDRAPKALLGMPERLVSRFESGVVADIRPPDYETRLAILGRLSTSEGIAIGSEELSYLAEKVATNIRALEGAFTKIVAYASLTGQRLTLPLIEETLKDLTVAEAPRRLSVETIRDEVCRYFEISSEEIVSRRRTKKIVLPRQIAMFLARDLTDETLAGIGKAFGKDDHTTVIHACEKVEKLLREGAPDSEIVRTLRIRLKELKQG